MSDYSMLMYLIVMWALVINITVDYEDRSCCALLRGLGAYA